MKIDSIDFFYLAMPTILDIGDGSQDALLVRVRSDDGTVGWGECEASPLVSIANLVCPMSHLACHSVQDAVLGQRVDSAADIEAIHRRARHMGLDIAQTEHTLSGVDIALWDLLGRKRSEPVYRLLGDERAYAKTPYASVLFGQTPQQTLRQAQQCRDAGFSAAKFGWGPFGASTVQADVEHVLAAREGLGSERVLLIDAGTVFGEDVAAARQRLDVLKQAKATWFEEPFIGGATQAYHELSRQSAPVKLAGGEGAHSFHMARQLIDHGGVGYIQIDTGRIGGISPAKRVADYAAARGVTYVNHTFTTQLALSASLQPFAGRQDDVICEFPTQPTALGRELTGSVTLLKDGQVRVPEAPGLGVQPDARAIAKYLVDVEIKVGGKVLYRTPKL